MKPQISVIVPVYKVERYLRRCVQSILNQTHSNLEVILVDDGSPDGSGALCDEFAKQDSRVQVIHKDNGGLSDARNAGLSIARGDYVTFVDSDDWIEPDAYEAMLALAEESGAQLVCAGRYDEDETTGQISVGLCPEKRELISDKEALRRILRWDNMDSSACDKLYARTLFRDIRYPVGRVVEDVATTYRLVLEAGSVAMLPKPVYHYCHRAESISTAAFSEKTFHIPENAQRACDAVVARYPELERDARYFCVNAMENLVQAIDLAPAEDRKKYAKERAHYRRALREQIGFVLGYDLFTLRGRVDFLFTALGLFGPTVKVVRFLKK